MYTKLFFYCSWGRYKVQKKFLANFNHVFTIYFMAKVSLWRYLEIHFNKLEFFLYMDHVTW